MSCVCVSFHLCSGSRSHVTCCHVVLRAVLSYEMSWYGCRVLSWHVMVCNVMSCAGSGRHVKCSHVTLCHVFSCVLFLGFLCRVHNLNVMRHVLSYYMSSFHMRHVMSCHSTCHVLWNVMPWMSSDATSMPDCLVSCDMMSCHVTSVILRNTPVCHFYHSNRGSFSCVMYTVNVIPFV